MATEIGLKPAGGGPQNADGTYPYDSSLEGDGSVGGLYGKVPHQMIAGSLRFLEITIPDNVVQSFENEYTVGTANQSLKAGVTYVISGGIPNPAVNWSDVHADVETHPSTGAIDLHDEFTIGDSDIDLGTVANFGAGTSGVKIKPKNASNAFVLENVVKALQMRGTISQLGNPNTATDTFRHPAIKEITTEEAAADSAVGLFKVRVVIENNGHRVKEFETDLKSVFGGEVVQTSTPGVIDVTGGAAVTVREINF